MATADTRAQLPGEPTARKGTPFLSATMEGQMVERTRM